MEAMNETEALSAMKALDECVRACSHCASRDILEGNMVECAMICLDCADVCAATLKVMARHSAHHGDFAKLCAHICRASATECRKHGHEHCKQCAAACEKCADECDKHAAEADV